MTSRLVRAVAVAAAGLALSVATVVTGQAAPEVLPETTSVDFSLDLEVVATADAPLLYVLEQRARPDHRIFSFDPATGEEQTVFTVPEDAIIYGIDLAPAGDTLAIAYTTDHALAGAGLFTLDLATSELTEVVAVAEDVYLTEPEWSADGSSVLTTRVDRTGDEEQLDVVLVTVADGSVDLIVADAVTPAVAGAAVHYLAVDEETAARRSVRSIDLVTGEEVTVASGEADLDHLVADGAGQVFVAALESDDATGLSFGAPAEAHGSHDVPSTWWQLSTPAELSSAPSTTYDAAWVDGHLAEVTLEGLSLVTLSADGDAQATHLIASRALRFITG